MGSEKKETLLFHTTTIEAALQELESSSQGLSEAELESRRAKYGKNELDEGQKRSLWQMLLEQFKNVMVIILMVAAVISGAMHEYADAAIILFVVVINAILGVMQESKAEKALAALKSMSSPYAKVKRDGKVSTIPTSELVPGDIVLLEAGDYVPADMRLLESASLKIEESALTGESVPVEKFTAPLAEAELVIGDRKNMAYLGSSVAYGRGSGVVTATGMKTEVGKIAGYLTQYQVEETPLQKRLAQMGKYISIGVVAISVIIFLVGVLEGRDYLEMFLTAVSLAVAAIPEGLPAIVTIVLAMGVQKMSKRNAIIRKLPAVETLGSTEIICSDKTGTLTQNRMTVKEIYLEQQLSSVDNLAVEQSSLQLMLAGLTLCNDSKVTQDEQGKLKLVGDPTETALISFATEQGLSKDQAEQAMPRQGELPFDSDRKLMTTINQSANNTLRAFTKGAPDVLLERCTKVWRGGKVEAITPEILTQIKAANKQMASKALRVLALAYRELPSLPNELTPELLEQELVFVGLVGMIDPPREEVKEAVRVAKVAGIKPIMITGDHQDTAVAIAKELGILTDEREAITGSELDKISEADFKEKVKQFVVYARVSPEHKVRIVKAWKEQGKIVAMTGDGVNDAPALKTADIGVGMGITGTDVSKGVSDMVLADDNFATIVLAVEEGRKIYSNIQKSIQFLLSCNLGEVVALFVATLLNWQLLLPIHILWVNLVTDTFPALALGVERSEPDLMQQPPRKAQATFLSEGVGVNLLYQGITQGLITVFTYYLGLRLYTSPVIATTMAFATLGLVQLCHSVNVRSNRKSIFKLGFFTNPYLFGAILLSAFLQLMVILIPFMNKIFKVTPLNLEQWLIVIGSAVVIIPIVELVKLVANLVKRNQKVS